MISNPITFFVSGSDTKSFTYDIDPHRDLTLFHFSPKENGLSTAMNCNIVFFAHDDLHAKKILSDMFDFAIECNRLYMLTKFGKILKDEIDVEKFHRDLGYTNAQSVYSSITKWYRYKRALDNNLIQLTQAPMNQMFKVGWADNDTV